MKQVISRLLALAVLTMLCATNAFADGVQDLIKALQAGQVKESPFVEGSRYPFPLAPSQPVYEAPKAIQINPNPLLLREQVITERLGGAGSQYNNPLNRALQGALYDAINKR